ncbi:MAG TPA: hypothetical protein PK435_09705 [Thermoanaerobaculaceae bacterium]|nr:hypothetical protein [Thermoanaerobaculaceae bacterium]
MRLVQSVFAVLFVASAPALAETLSPSPAALMRLRELRPSRLGVDRQGDLWSWNRTTGVIQVLSHAGKLRIGPVVDGAACVDYDPEWGAVGLSSIGREMLFVGRGDAVMQRVLLPEQAASICWVGASTVAVSPTFAAHRVKLWDLKTGLQVLTIGDEIPIRPHIGAVLARTILLHFDSRRERLVTLDAFSGGLEVFSLAGKLLSRTTLPVPESERRSVLDWLAQVDRQARERSQVQTPILYYFSDVAIDERGDVWAVTERDRSRGRTTVAVAHENGKVDLQTYETPNCCAPLLAVWGDQLVQYSDAVLSSTFCVEERRIP